MIGQPDEQDLDRWLTADVAALRGDLDRTLRPEAAEAPEAGEAAKAPEAGGTPQAEPAAGPPRPPSDAELIEAVRSGATGAYGQLYERHVHAARNLARQLAWSSAEADDLVSEAFAKVLDTLRAGRGPDSAFRAYLFAALRHTAYDRTRREKRVRLADDVTAVSGVEDVTAVPFHDPAVAMLERSLATKAFASLPERWQTVLWQTEVEGQSPAELAPLMGLTANSAAALAHRAREGLKKAYLQAHLARTPSNRCRATVAKLGAWTRRGLARRESAQVGAHLDKCVDCRALADELADVNGTMRAVIAPLVLGVGTSGYLATVGATEATAATAATAAGTAGTVTSTSHWLGAGASTTAAVVAVVWSLGVGQQTAVPPAEAAPPTPNVSQQGSTTTTTTTTSPTGPSTTSDPNSPTTTAPTGGTSTSVPPGGTVPGEPPANPAPEPLVAVVPDGFAITTGGPPTDLPITLRNTGRTPVPPATLVLSLPEGVQVVGPGGNLRRGPLVRFDGEMAQIVGCPAGKGTVTCTAGQDLPAGASVTFVFRLLAGPKSSSGTITGTATSGQVPPARVELPITITPKK
ncbi:RNA polymerase sigma factor (sigma-70 family) [Saccharothrix tamanrassetensis]|uniref:RNA polymerase sigma factor (Sigma-70 family) n=1 Tax=Saccharothrix tamanrassetensis TaxID=1051531 RepID=A0A841CFX8_9PSEU|nr:RNA polymerase sigma factor [Saccharothrix tamanrassetensis]MBB5955900.1 RNA polymerase sigma factor (sigma-70 family) [Saccharothrix tamanrassetensis]